jgi:hypothetical protein
MMSTESVIDIPGYIASEWTVSIPSTPRSDSPYGT